jgi:Tfp pilus assembly protein PilX
MREKDTMTCGHSSILQFEIYHLHFALAAAEGRAMPEERNRMTQKSGTGGRRTAFPEPGNNQCGMALITALIMLLLLTILGAWAVDTSTAELRITRNYRNTREAFYAADAAINYGQTDAAIYAAIKPDRTSPDCVWPRKGNGNGVDRDFNAVPGLGANSADVRVEFVASGPPPPGSGADPEMSQGLYFIVTAKGWGPQYTEVAVESQVVRIVPR